MSSKDRVKVPQGHRLSLIHNPNYIKSVLSPVLVRTVEQDRELIQASERIYQGGVQDAINELGPLPISPKCFARFRAYQETTGKRIFEGIDANPDEIARVKKERQAFAKDIEGYVREHFDEHNKGYVDFSSVEEAEEVLRAPAALISMARATRNMTFSNKPLIDSIRSQAECFAEDRSSLGPNSAANINDVNEDKASLFRYMRERFRQYKEGSEGKWRPPKLKQKTTSCLESDTASGGRNAFEIAVVESFMAATYTASNCDLIDKAIATGVHLGLNPVKFRNGERLQRAFVSSDPRKPYGKFHTFQDIKLLSMLVLGVQEQKLTLFPYDPSEDLICFDGAKDRYRGSRIIELAGKDRTVSIGSAIISVIGEYLASQLRGILLFTPEFQEGYLGSEDMKELLTRLNGDDSGKTSTFNTAIEELLENPILLEHKDPREPDAKRRKGDTAYWPYKGPLEPLRVLITDFTAATENISHSFSRMIATEFRISAMPGEPFSGARWPSAHAAYIEFISSDFGIDYASGAGGEYSVDSENGVGLLMGSAYTKEILHIGSAWASNGDSENLNRARLVLGDDLLLLVFAAFLRRATMAGLQTNFDKTQISFAPTLTDRSVIIVRVGSGYDRKFYLYGSDISPPKLYSVSAKYSEGQQFYCSIPRTGAILRSLVSEDLKSIRFPTMFKEIENSMNSISFLQEVVNNDPGKGIPLAYGGSKWCNDFEEREWMLRNCSICIANLFGACDSRYRITIFHSDREKDWRKVGFVRLDAVNHIITDYCPSFIGLDDSLESDRFAINDAKEFLKRIYPEEISERTYSSSIFYISPEEILKIFQNPYSSDTDLFDYGNYKVERLDNDNFKTYSYLLESLDIMSSGIATSAQVQRPPL